MIHRPLSFLKRPTTAVHVRFAASKANTASPHPPSAMSSSPVTATPASTDGVSLKRKAQDDQPASSPLAKSSGTASAQTAPKKQKNSSITAFFGAPKSNPGAAPVAANGASSTDAATAKADGATATNGANVADGAFGLLNGAAPRKKFDKEAWAAKLTPEQRELLKLELETLHESWFGVLAEELKSKEFLALKAFLQAEKAAGKTVFPPEKEIYSWSNHTPLHTVKAVIVGQDPYHNVNQAHGLCFSVRPPTPAPPSLKNIYTALRKDYPGFAPPPRNGGLLTPWADRGVLLLNTCLTVRAHEANSHAGKGWERFTQRVLDAVARERRRGVVFLAWGSPAQKRCVGIAAKHLVLKSVHPSPLSAARGFFDCGHFKKANDWLAERYGVDQGPIDWDLNVAPEEAGV